MDRQETEYYRHIQGETVTQLLFRYLELEGTETIFGIPGKPIQEILDELQRRSAGPGPRYVLCRHEGGAAYMADGYARTTGRLGVVLVTSGPGATNTLTGFLNAQCGHSPVLVIGGEVPAAQVGKGYLQDGYASEINTCSIFRGATRSSNLISHPNNFPTLFGQAIRDAMATPHGASYVGIPEGIASEVVADVRFPKRPEHLHPNAAPSDPESAGQALEALLRASRPLVLLGNGCRSALTGERLSRFLELVERFALPVMTTSNGKGIFPETHPLSLRHYGAASCPWAVQYMESDAPRYDALLVLGSTLGQWGTQSWHPRLIPDGPLIQVDIDQGTIARCFPVSLGVVADAGRFVDDLVAQGQERAGDSDLVSARRTALERLKAQTSPFLDPDKRESIQEPILPQALMKHISESLAPGSHVFIDAGNCVGWSLHHLTLEPPTQYHISLTMAPMGFGVCAVIGGKIGAPHLTCLAIVGDGAFLMHGTEVSTAAQYGVGAIWVVLADDDMAMVSQGMSYLHPQTPGWTEAYRLGRADIVQFAASLGADTYPVHTVDEAREALRLAQERATSERKPQVIVAAIDRSEVPPYYPTPHPPKPEPPAPERA